MTSFIRSFVTAAVVLSLLCLANPVLAQDEEPVKKGDNLVSVTVTGAGMDKEEATLDAKRKAVEKGAGSFIHSNSQVENFELTRDTIIARSAGFLQSFKVLKASQQADDTWEVKITAEVSINGIEDTWGVVQQMLKDHGRPKIMVFINEKIGNKVIEDSTVQTKIEEELLKSGFLLVNKEQIKAIDRKDMAAAVAEDKPDKMQAIAKRFGAQIFISGSAYAEAGANTEVGGLVLSTYEAEANVKTYRSDTAQLMSSIAGKPERGAARVANSAAKQALDFEAKQIADRITQDVLRFWADVLDGRGEVQLHIEGITFKQYRALKKQLQAIKGVKDVNAEFHNGNAECSFVSDQQAEKLAEKIEDAVEGLEISDVSANVIKASFKGGDK